MAKSDKALTATPESTGQQAGQRADIATRFKPGQSGNPAGRPKGSRNKLGEDLIGAFCADFEKYGARAIRRLRKEDLPTYMRVAASLVPKEFNVSGSVSHAHEHLHAADEAGLSALAALIAEAGAGGAAGGRKKAVPH